MRTLGAIPRLLILASLLLGLAGVTSANGHQFKVIVHPDNPSDGVSRDFLRDAYLKKTTTWHGVTIRPIDLSSKFPEREHFTRQVIRKTPAQLRSYWNQQVFSGKGVPPPEGASIADIIAYVVANPGGVGYIPIDADPGQAKVIRIVE